jgi:hypothetical protein
MLSHYLTTLFIYIFLDAIFVIVIIIQLAITF